MRKLTLKQKQDIAWSFMIGNEPWSIVHGESVEVKIHVRQIEVIREFCNGKFKLAKGKK